MRRKRSQRLRYTVKKNWGGRDRNSLSSPRMVCDLLVQRKFLKLKMTEDKGSKSKFRDSTTAFEVAF